jgi:hypothetical protein
MLRNANKPDFNFGHGGAHMYGWNNLFRAYPKQDYALVVAVNNWDMTSGVYGYREAQLIFDFVSSWLKNEKANIKRVQPSASWAWKTSYVIGLIMAEQLKGALGIKSPLTPQMIEAMACGAKVRTGTEKEVSIWNPAGFRAGVEDMLSIEMTPASIKAFLQSERLRVAPEELETLYLQIGGSGVPFRFDTN